MTHALSRVLRGLTLLAATMVAGLAHAATLDVCPTGGGCTYATIQSAVNAAAYGDTILVGDGLYRENVNIPIPLSLVSVNGAASTTIDGMGTGACVLITAPNSNSQHLVRGFTLTNGTGHATYGGGGICYMGDGDLQHLTVEGCTITGNRSVANGGGISVGWPYGGVLLDVRDTQILGNTAALEGGGLHSQSPMGTTTVDGCRIEGNTALDGRGGGIMVNRDLFVTNTLLVGNEAVTVSSPYPNQGGAIFSRNEAAFTVTNCTIVGNTASATGGIFYGAYGVTVTNTILWDNSAPQIGTVSTWPATVSYSDAQGGWPTGAGNIDAAPLFGSLDNYTLLPSSPCIDSGTNDGAPSVDGLGNQRPTDGNGDGVAVADMGWAEAPAQAPSIAITKALHDYVADRLEINATSLSGATAGLSVDGFGPLAWDKKLRIWKGIFASPAAPVSITVRDVYGNTRTID